MGFFRENIERMEGYQPGEQPQDGQYIKLNTNENPYPPSPKVAEAINKEANTSIRLYPSPMADLLRRKAAKVYDCRHLVARPNIFLPHYSKNQFTIRSRSG